MSTLRQKFGSLRLGRPKDSEACISLAWIAAIVFPLIVVATLYLAKPQSVLKEDEDVVDPTKAATMTILSTLVVWCGLYVLTNCGSGWFPAICARG